MKLTGINVDNYFTPNIIKDNCKVYFATSSILPPNHENKGITILPTFEDIPDLGKLMISQFASNHILSITLDNGEIKTFDSIGQRYKDTNTPTDCFYKTYIIKNKLFYEDSFFNEPIMPIFNDAPFRELLDDWISIIYKIEFETWFLYSIGNNTVPLGKFEWKIDCKVSKYKDEWYIDENKSSTEIYTKNSLLIIGNINNVFVPNFNDKQLHQTVVSFLEKNLKQ